MDNSIVEDARTTSFAQRAKAAAKSLLDDVVWMIVDPQGWKGEAFERKVVKKLKSLYPAAGVFHHVYVPEEDGSTSELDVVMASGKAVYVIECKNYAGWIFGKESDRQWTQMLNRSTKIRFYNPIMQNKTHVKRLAGYLEPETDGAEIPIENVVLFADKAELKKVKVDSKDVLLIRFGKLASTVKKLEKKRCEPLGDELREKTCALLGDLAIPGRAAKEKHVEKIRGGV